MKQRVITRPASVKVDFHTHSALSPDGALTAQNYRRALERGRLDCIAVTDHNETDFALELHKAFGDRIIVGEEITALEGEIIGLFLAETIAPNQSVAETIEAIHAQGGLVYVPHPFETVRKGVAAPVLDAVAKQVDIVEVYNGRAVFQNRSDQASDWAVRHNVPAAAGSDAHGPAGWGRTYTELAAMPTRDTLIALLQDATYTRGFPGLRGIGYPKLNRLRKKLTNGK